MKNSLKKQALKSLYLNVESLRRRNTTHLS
jgi:hypothetical protein